MRTCSVPINQSSTIRRTSGEIVRQFLRRRRRGGRRANASELQLVLQRRQVQVQPLQLPRSTSAARARARAAILVVVRRRGRRHLVAPHVAAERLPHREREAADGAGVKPGLQLQHLPLQVAPRPAVAGAVPAQRLERREPAAAGLALEQAAAAAVLAAAGEQQQI
ncbi:hypothetical protein Cni_G10679 [Canna indica]|uniref:Uncharacterized protein n=1 Tax=Canna indica TaxID=4628 RepID=A0AAQ3K4V9_9LILI|nr:hypothetical protein Cni_G10679 [Canna indica]